LKKPLVFLCTCNGKIPINIKSVYEHLKKRGAETVYHTRSICGGDYSDDIADKLRASSIVGACGKKTVFETIVQKSFLYVDLLVLCSWVHNDEKKITEKSGRMLAAEVASRIGTNIIRNYDDLETIHSYIVPGENNRYLAADLKNCPSRSKWSCTVCKDACPVNAISGVGVTVTNRCDVCGICESSCPIGLINKVPFDNTDFKIEELLLESKKTPFNDALGKKIIAFMCEDAIDTMKRIGLYNLEYPPEILPLEIDNIGNIGINHLLKVFDRGGEGIIIGGCEECDDKSIDFLKKNINKFTKAFKDTAIENRIDLIKVGDDDEEKLHNKFIDFSDRIFEEEPLNIGRAVLNNEEDENRREKDKLGYENKRLEMLRMLKNISSSLDIDEEQILDQFDTFRNIELDTEACDGCQECVEKCNLNVLNLNNDIFMKKDWMCIGCGRCKNVCPVDAIDLVKPDKLPEIEKSYDVID